MQLWFDTVGAHLAERLTQVLKVNAAYNRTLAPFRFHQVTQQFVATLQAFIQSREVSGASELGRTLAEQGLGLRTGFAMQKHLLDDVLSRPTPSVDGGPGGSGGSAPVLPLNDFMTAFLSGLAEGELHTLVRQRDDIQAALVRTIADRENALRRIIYELSTPIMPVSDQILVLPLIGELNPERTQQIAERVLMEVVAQKARVLLIDVTGISTLDQSAAAGLIQLVNAVQLLGARSILVGVSPALSRMLIALDVDLRSLRVEANLQHGIQRARALCKPQPAPRSPIGSRHDD